MATHSVPSLANPPRQRNPRRMAITGMLGLMGLLLAIQLVPFGRNHTNPPISAEPAWNSPQTRVLFMRACGDCHSNETVWPWYTNVAPASWLISRDVVEGREKMNISAWGQGENEADEAAETIQNGEMPPWFYMPLHPEANLSATERQQLINGLTATFGSEGGERNGDSDD